MPFGKRFFSISICEGFVIGGRPRYRHRMDPRFGFHFFHSADAGVSANPWGQKCICSSEDLMRTIYHDRDDFHSLEVKSADRLYRPPWRRSSEETELQSWEPSRSIHDNQRDVHFEIFVRRLLVYCLVGYLRFEVVIGFLLFRLFYMFIGTDIFLMAAFAVLMFSRVAVRATPHISFVPLPRPLPYIFVSESHRQIFTIA